MTEARAARVTPDVVVTLLLFAAAVAHLAALPHNLGSADEAFFLYEARRIREGEVMYRDFFQFVAPAAWYAMAVLYWIFGTSMTTARLAMAVVHGLTVALTYAAARRVRVRREIAVLPPLAYLALCQPAWPYASPHWFSTFLVAVLLFTALGEGNPRGLRRSVALGFGAGILCAVQQQRGAIMAAGIATLIVVEELARLRFRDFSIRVVLVRLLSLGLGIALAAVPIYGGMILAAGWQPVYRDLVIYPVFEYRGGTSGVWGNVTFLSANFAEHTWPRVLKYLPVAVAVPVLRSAALLISGRDWPQLRIVLTLSVFAAFSILSTLYNADFIHITFIAPVLFVTLTESVEWTLRMAPRRLALVTGWAVAAVIAIALGRKTYENTRWARDTFPFRHETAFGRIDFAAPWQAAFNDQARARLAQTPSHEVFCYPFLAAPYLTAGGRNPTPYQHLSPAQSPARHLEEAVSILQARRVPYIIAAPLFLRPSDPIAQLINKEYEYIPLPDTNESNELPRLWLFVRKDLQHPNEE